MMMISDVNYLLRFHWKILVVSPHQSDYFPSVLIHLCSVPPGIHYHFISFIYIVKKTQILWKLKKRKKEQQRN